MFSLKLSKAINTRCVKPAELKMEVLIVLSLLSLLFFSSLDSSLSLIFSCCPLFLSLWHNISGSPSSALSGRFSRAPPPCRLCAVGAVL